MVSSENRNKSLKFFLSVGIHTWIQTQPQRILSNLLDILNQTKKYCSYDGGIRILWGQYRHCSNIAIFNGGYEHPLGAVYMSLGHVIGLTTSPRQSCSRKHLGQLHCYPTIKRTGSTSEIPEGPHCRILLFEAVRFSSKKNRTLALSLSRFSP